MASSALVRFTFFLIVLLKEKNVGFHIAQQSREDTRSLVNTQ